jgi:DNA-binding IclR family transcriptional regulator
MPEDHDFSQEKPAYPIESVDAAMRLLLLVAQREQLRLADAAEALGVASSTAHRLMQMLIYFGFARQASDSKAYVAGPGLVGLALNVIGKLSIRDVARPHMTSLAADVEETVHLWALQPHGRVLCLESVEGPRMLRVGSRTGILAAASASAAGRAILSTMTDRDLVELYPDTSLTRVAHSPITRREDLLAAVRTASELGYAVQRNEIEPEVSAIAAPVRIGKGAAGFSVSVALPTSRLSEAATSALGVAVIGCAAQISAELGG